MITNKSLDFSVHLEWLWCDLWVFGACYLVSLSLPSMIRKLFRATSWWDRHQERVKIRMDRGLECHAHIYKSKKF